MPKFSKCTLYVWNTVYALCLRRLRCGPSSAGTWSAPYHSIPKQIDDNPLDDEDLFDVMEALLSIAAKWKNIAIALRLKIDDIDRIDACRQGSLRLQECLTDVLTMWLQRKYNVEKFGEPSWRKLVEVVANSAAGDNPTLANKLAEQHVNPSAATEEPPLKTDCSTISIADTEELLKNLSDETTDTSDVISADDAEPLDLSIVDDHHVDLITGYWLVQTAIQQLLPISAKWKDIGRSMGIQNLVLDAIEKDTEDPKDSLSRVLIHWIEVGKFTWRSLIAAVERSDGGNSRTIASEIRLHHLRLNLKKCSELTTPVTNAVNTPLRIASPYIFSEEKWYTEPWYQGHLNWHDSEERLELMSDGTFLVRNSLSSRGDYVISMKFNGKVVHFLVRVLQNPFGESSYEVQGSKLSFQTLPDLIRYYKSNPISGEQEKLIEHCPN